MKAIFNPNTDSVQEVLHFVEFCYDRGLEIHIETSGNPKVRRSVRKARKIQQNIEDDRQAFEKQTSSTAEEIDTENMGRKRRSPTRDRTGRKGRAPDINREMYNKIKAGDSEVLQLYAPHTINNVMKTKSWPQFLAYKADQARKKRELNKRRKLAARD